MPVSGQDGKIVLDYGCGPGHDLVGFAVYSKPKQLIGVDVSPTALNAAKKRLNLHSQNADFILINEKDNLIPLPSKSVDYIHSSGVLHHCSNLEVVLGELHRILKDDGSMSIMVYNYSSIWVNLYVAYLLKYKLKNFREKIKYRKFKGLALEEALRLSTDGIYCPISKFYKPEDFLFLLNQFGFKGIFKGAAISITEMKHLENRFDAISDQRLSNEQRDFLSALTFNNKGVPLIQRDVAGIDACYLFRKT